MPPGKGSMPAPRSRILAGPFDGHLNHAAVRNIFLPYGKVLAGAQYLLTKDPPRTYGFVDFKTEADAKNAIMNLTIGSFRSHGKDLRMLDVVAEGALPMRLKEWEYDLSYGARDSFTIPKLDDKDKTAVPRIIVEDHSTDVDKGDKGKAAESPSHVEDDSNNVGKSNKHKAADSLSRTEDDDSEDVGRGDSKDGEKGDKDQMVVPENLSETHSISDIDAADKKGKAVTAVPHLAAYSYETYKRLQDYTPDKGQPAVAPKKA